MLRYERPVYALILRMVRDRATAEDLAQESFLKMFRGLDTYQPGRKFASWLFKIAHNTTLDHLRRKELTTVPLTTPDDPDQRDLADVLEDPGAPSPELARQESELAADLERAVARLRPEYREVILLRFVQGLAYQEIAEVTGLALGTVKTHIHRARRALAALLAEAGWGLAEAALGDGETPGGSGS